MQIQKLILPFCIIFILNSCKDNSKTYSSAETELNAQGFVFWKWKSTNGEWVGINKKNGDILVPPNISKLNLSGNILHGYKQPCERPAEWMSDDWDKESWFVLSQGEVLWFGTESDCKDAIEKLRTPTTKN